MIWFFAVVVVVALGAIALVASGRGEPMVDDYDDRPDALVPATGDLGSADLRRVRFSLALRGYRMSEVDALLTRLADELERREAFRPRPEGAEGAAAPAAEPAAEPAEPTESAEVRLDKPSESRGDDVRPE